MSVCLSVCLLAYLNRKLSYHKHTARCAVSDNVLSTTALFCTVSDILSVISLNLKRSRDPEHIPLEGDLSYALILASVSLHTKFGVPNFTHSKDMLGATTFKK